MFKQAENKLDISPEMIAIAEKLIGLSFTDAEREQMMAGMQANLESYGEIRGVRLANDVMPALNFSPSPPSSLPLSPPPALSLAPDTPLSRPENLEDLAFATVVQLADLLKRGEVRSVELTQMYLTRLKRYDKHLECVVTLTEDLAMQQATRADEEIAAGHYRGMLHGIPWGAKDLLAVRGYKTTWGAMPYKDQFIDQDATVVKKLTEAGAVLVAKLTSGALAYGDIWFDGVTKNPWNLDEGSSGSSAGPGAAVAGGLVGFAIGSETLGSIVSPCSRCGITGLRPTFGRVSRHGAMALSWSMDKLGPMVRGVLDAGIIHQHIHGHDPKDPTSVNQPFDFPFSGDWRDLRIGYVKSAFDLEGDNQANDQETLRVLRELGANLIPIELPNYPYSAMVIILAVEAAAAFAELTEKDTDDLLKWQDEEAWPNTFRRTRLIPAVEYVQANRIRTLAMQDIARLMANIDVYVAPSFRGSNLTLTNFTGHPTVVLPNGADEGNPSNHSITFTGQLYGESALLAVAQAYQAATGWHKLVPAMRYAEIGD